MKPDGQEPPSTLGPEPGDRVLRALDATVADLQSLGRNPVAVAVPAEVARRLDALLSGLAEATAPGDVADLATHRRRRARRAGVLAAVAAGVVGVAALTGVLATAQSTTPGAPTATRLELGVANPLGTTVLAALGAVDLGTRLSDPATLRGCLRANGVPARTQLLGSAQVDLKGIPGTLLLLPTQTAGSFVALVVGPGCSAEDPSLITSARIGR
ncbi:MAG: hypothetical protein ABI181_02295 [Mycobacteriaceae bacterium]